MADLSCDDSTSVGTPVQPQLHAMGAARRDPRRGAIPVTHSQVRFPLLPWPGVVVSNTGKHKLIQISEGSRPAVSLRMQQGGFIHIGGPNVGGPNELNRRILRHPASAQAAN